MDGHGKNNLLRGIRPFCECFFKKLFSKRFQKNPLRTKPRFQFQNSRNILLGKVQSYATTF